METRSTQYTVAEIRDMFARRELRVDRSFQRSSKLWPKNAKSYFIDTIINNFIVPPVYFKETLDRSTKKTIRYIVDGQQRLTTLDEFISDDFALNVNSPKFAKMKFSDLDVSVQMDILGYSIKAERIITGSDEEILEMFRRINSFTMPLNNAEKRHSEYQGEFKWFINKMADKYSSLLLEFGILTNKQILRMADAELLSEIAELIKFGIVNRSSSRLARMYKENDNEFPEFDTYETIISDTLDFISNNFGSFAKGPLMKSYNFYSLSAALIQNKYGLGGEPNDKMTLKQGRFLGSTATPENNFNCLIEAVELKGDANQFVDFVKASTSTTHGANHRSIRAKYFQQALNLDDITRH